MLRFSFTENVIHAQLVQSGELEIDNEGRIWRVRCRRSHRPAADGSTFKVRPCARRRAEAKSTKGYLIVKLLLNGVHWQCFARRLVWRHFFGEIPDGLTINHKAATGDRTDNRPENLELATQSEQLLHAYRVLGRPISGCAVHDGPLNPRDVATGRFFSPSAP